MTARFELSVDAADGAARATTVVTPRGSYRTPLFMPVGTRGTVVHLDPSEYDELGARIVLANTYHLMLRPGVEVVERLGGLRGFCGWDGLFLTDSGGYQVMSLEPDVDDDGVTFRSTYDGDLVRFTPEDAVAVQERLGADVQMALDVCPPLPADDGVVRLAMDRTHAWVRRAAAAHRREDQALFGIVQGGVDTGMRAESARFLADLDLPGYGIGGLSVGERSEERLPALAAALEHLPADRPRYLMGVGDPVSVVEAIGLGVDQFDCVLPTRLARHGYLLTSEGRLNLRNLRFRLDDGPLDPAGTHPRCRRYSRAYLRHLLLVREPTAGRIATLHNLWFLVQLVERARAAVVDGSFAAFRDQVRSVWG